MAFGALASMASRAIPFISKLFKGGGAGMLAKGLRKFGPSITKGFNFANKVLGGASKFTDKALQAGQVAQGSLDMAKKVGLIPKGESGAERALQRGIRGGRSLQGNIDSASGKLKSGRAHANRFAPF